MTSASREPSKVDDPVFVDGHNDGGASPPLVGHAVLASLVRACLGARVAMVPDALVVALGRAAAAAVTLLVEQALLEWSTG